MSYNLTFNEIQILHWKVQGLRYIDIAKRLGIANSTLSKYMTAICKKLGVNTKAAAIYRAREMFPSVIKKGLFLTSKEQEIIFLLACDLSTKQIAKELDVSVGRVNDRIHDACKRAGAVDREHLIAILPKSKFY